ncbi:hypothetical protein D7B24_001473 [Verticillium nonalfalfae]|uniref:Uncharacterized protein n=1 Tax=Verticillium nonalfalfae TaxID=1051616 RepID=A0A3M9YL39_9PEZI|nr:uncharacterized protein D7B24_001473 [Verticillium nonalfalfae]RNJ59750.1 hypothetical protein D7B24_001473 [Verticillium nonalfalfae]
MRDGKNKGVPMAKRQKTSDTRTPVTQDKPAPLNDQPCAADSSHTPNGSEVIARAAISPSPPIIFSEKELIPSTSTTVKGLGASSYCSFPRKLPQGPGVVAYKRHMNYFKVLLRTPGSLGLATFGLGLPGDLIGRLDEDNLKFVYARTSSENTRHTLQMKLYSQPCLSLIEPASKSFLDLGAGSGVWASDEPTPMPPNLHFVDMNIVHGPPVGSRATSDDLVDMIRVSHAIAQVTDRNYLLDTCYSALNNGGYLEIQAFEPIVRKRDEPENFDHPLNIFFRLLCKETLPDLKAVHPVEDLVDALGTAGFTEVEVMTQLVPIGQQQDMSWLKRKVAGALFRQVLHSYISHIDRTKFTLRGLNDEQIDALIQMTRYAINAKDNRYYMRLVFVSGKKESRDYDDGTTKLESSSEANESVELVIGGGPDFSRTDPESPL